MASYEPPTATYPIFDSLAFVSPNSESITIAEADARYLARNNIATSNASLTAFAGDITIGNSTFDYASGTGLTIKTTTSGESIFANVLSGVTVKPKFELNPTYTHLYDAVRITDSGTPSNYTLFQQSTTTLNIDNVVASSTINFKTTSSAPASVTSLSLSSTAITANLPLTLGYTTTPAAGQLGFRTKTIATASTAITNNGLITLITGGFSLTAGTYLITLNGYITTTAVAGSVTTYELGVGTANNNFVLFSDTVLGTYSVPAIAGVITGQTTQVVNITATTTYFFNHRLNFTTIVPTVSTANTYIQYTRIA